MTEVVRNRVRFEIVAVFQSTCHIIGGSGCLLTLADNHIDLCRTDKMVWISDSESEDPQPQASSSNVQITDGEYSVWSSGYLQGD